MKYDIVVIGAGAAGVTAAQLAAREFDVILIDSAERAAYRPSSGVFPDHNNIGFDPIPDSVFARDHLKMRYLGMDSQAIVSGAEFNRRLGKILYLPKYLDYALSQAESYGLTSLFNTTATGVCITSDGVSINCQGPGGKNQLQEIKAEVALLATGGANFRLHHSLGFQLPRVHQAIQAEFQKDETELAKWEAEYTFHVYSKISQAGPFWVTRRVGEFDVGFIDRTVSREKFDSILARHAPLQSLLRGAKPFIPAGKSQHVFVSSIASDPIKDLVKDRVLVLGDAAGTATNFYYEGVGQARYAALYAIEHLRALQADGKAPTRANLQPYQERVHRDINGKLYKSGLGSRTIFYENGNMDTIFSTFIQVVNKHADAREKIAFAYWNNPVNYKFSNDSDVGRKIYEQLPFSKKITLLPLFVKASLK